MKKRFVTQHRQSAWLPVFLLMGVLSLVLLPACQSSQQATVTPGVTSQPVNVSATPSFTLSPTLTLTVTPENTTTPTITPTPTAVILAAGNIASNINPLTGLPAAPGLLNRRPVMVKVSNFPRDARPHAGLSFADIVFDYYIGEGTNRFLALYYGQDAEQIGPVRSARLVDAQLVRLFEGILAYSGADQNAVDPVIMTNLRQRAISSAPITCPALCDTGGNTVNSVFASSALLSNLAVEKGVVTPDDVHGLLQAWSFDSRPPAAATPAGDSVTVRFNAYNLAEWRFDPDQSRYLRWIEDVDTDNNLAMIPLTDRITGEQLAFSNVIILFAPYTTHAETLHEISLWYNYNGRRAVIFRDGKMMEAVWKTPDQDRPFQLLTEDGEPMPLKPGNTWVVIAGINSTLKENVPGQWELRFFLP